MTDQGLHAILRTQLRQYFDAHGDQLPPAGLYQRMIATLELPLLEETLRATHGNQLKAAHLLGLNRNTLHKKLKYHGLLKPRRSMPAKRPPHRRQHGDT